MGKVSGRNLDNVDVFEDGPHADWLIDSADVPGDIKGNAAIYDKLKPLTLRDLYHLVGFRHRGDDLEFSSCRDIGRKGRDEVPSALQEADCFLVGEPVNGSSCGALVPPDRVQGSAGTLEVCGDGAADCVRVVPL